MKNKIKILITLILSLIMISTSSVYGYNNNYESENKNILSNNNKLFNILNGDQNQIGEVTKKIWNETSQQWEDSIIADLGDILTFNISVTYIPKYWISWMVYYITVNDTLPSCLQYIEDSAITYWNGNQFYGQSSISWTENKVYWDLSEDHNVQLYNTSKWTLSNYPDTFYIIYNAEVIGCTGESYESNIAKVKGWETCKTRWVYGEAESYIKVACPRPSIDVEKQVSRDGTNWYDSINDIVINCDNIYWKIIVTNTGQTTLNVDLTDDNTGTILTGYTLAAGETWEDTYGPITPQSGLNENTADATGHPPSGSPVTDSDTASYTGKIISIDVEKQVSRDGTNWYDSINDMIIGIDQVYWKIIVTNTGQLPLEIDLTDDNTGTILTGHTLAVGETWEDTYGPYPVETGLNENTAEVDGYYGECLTQDSATADYTGNNEGGCTYTIGYWKTHIFDETWLEISSKGIFTEFLDTGKTYFQILWSSSKDGNAYIILARQYIAADLNRLMNEDNLPQVIKDEMTLAKSLLENPTYMYSLDIPKENIQDRNEAIRIAGVLDHFNNGGYGLYPGWYHCDDIDEQPLSQNIIIDIITKTLELINRLSS